MSLVLGEKFIAECLICDRIGKYLEHPNHCGPCDAAPSRTRSYASDRVLICLNTCGLLKRAALERKKPAGDETHAFLTCFTKVRLGASHYVLPSFNKIRTILKYHIFLRKELL